MKPVVYADANCYQRSFDDARQLRIQLESLACQEVFRLAEAGEIDLAWSFMLEDEVRLCPFPDRQLEMRELSELCRVRIAPDESIRMRAKEFERVASIRPKDAIHLACAEHVAAKELLTCDDRFIDRAKRLQIGTAVLSPLDFVRRRFDEPDPSTT